MERTPSQLEEQLGQVQKRITTLAESIEKAIKRGADVVFNRRLAKLGRWRILLVLVLLTAFFAPTLAIGATAYAQYTQLKSLGLDGVHQLLAIKDLLPLSSNTTTSSTSVSTSCTTTKAQPTPTVAPTSTPTTAGGTTNSGITQKAQDILNPTTLANIKQHSDAARRDFTQIHTMIAQRQGIIGFALITPYGAEINAVEELSVVGIDAANLISELATIGTDFTDSFKTSPFSSEGGPILTQKSFADLQQGLQDTLVTLQDIQLHLAKVNLANLPICASQRAQIQKYIPDLPKAITDITKLQPYLPLASWAMGVDNQRQYLIQTMDRAELRPSGGFNGSWGILGVNGGRVGAIQMTDVTFVDYSTSNKAYGQQVPAQYSNWWPFGNWGLRDANLSGDFPTSANLAITTYAKEEGVAKPDGAVSFSPLVIEHLLSNDVLGPITIPCYDVTVTSTNLEDTLHYFQLDSRGLAKQDQCSPNNHQTSLRKRFTSALATALEDKVRSAPQSKLINILQSLRHDLLTKDLEVWFSNDSIQHLLAKDSLDAAMLRNPAIDSTYIVNADIGVNKGAQFLTTKTTETVTLDANGNAFHNLLVQFDYHPTGNVYGLLTYRDYVRVYTAPNAVFLGGTGFDRYKDPPLCYISPPTTSPPPGGTPTPPPTPSPTPPPTKDGIPIDPPDKPCQPSDAAACTSGTFFPGQSPGGASEGSSPTQIDDVGAPTALTSDEPGRGMFGGLVVIPAFCKGALVLAWEVPHIAGTAAQHNQPYTFVEQRQSGSVTEFVLQIRPASGVNVATVHDDLKPLTQDCAWVLGSKPASSCDAPNS